MDDLEQKFSKAPHDTQIFDKLVHKYTREECWEELIHLHIDHANAIKTETKGEAYRYYIQAVRLQKLHQEFSEQTLEVLQVCMSLLPERDEAFLEMEMHYQNKKNWSKLIDIYSKKLEHTSSVATQEELLLNIANIYFLELKDLQSAANIYENAAKVNSQNKITLFRLLDIYEKQQQHEKHGDILQSLIELGELPEEKDRYYFQLAELQFEQQFYHKAAASYRKIVGMHYQEKIVERLQNIYKDDPENLVIVLNQKLNILKHKDEKTKTYLQLASLKDQHFSELDTALLFYEKALLLKPDLDTIEKICDVLWRKDNTHAWYLYKKQKIVMLSSKQEKAYALHSCAVDLKSSKQSEENIDRLIEIYKNILELSPQDSIAIDYLTKTYQTLHNYEQLVKILVHKSKYSSLAERVSIYIQIAKLLSESLNQQEEASSYYQKVMAIQGDHNEALLQLRNKYTESKDYGELIKVIEDEIRLTAIDPEIRYHEIGKIYEEHLQQYEDAIVYFKKAIAANTLFLPSYVSLRNLYQKMGNTEQVISVGEKEIAVNENKQESIELHFLLAKAYDGHNDEKQEYHLQKILCYEPDEATASDLLLQKYAGNSDWQNYIDLLLNKAAFQPYAEEIVDLYKQVASVYEEKLSDLVSAKKYYIKMHYLQPTELETIRKLSEICKDLQQTTEQISYLQKEVTLLEDQDVAAQIERSIGDIYIAENKSIQAISFYEKSLTRSPNNIEVLLLLEELYNSNKIEKKLIANLDKQTFLVDDVKRRVLYKRLTELNEDIDVKISYLQKWQNLDFAAAYDDLESCYAQKEMWRELCDLYAKKLAQEEQLDVLRKATNIYEQYIDDNYKLQKLYIAMLKHSNDASLIDKLEKVSYKISDWSKILEICALKLAKGKQQKIYEQMGDIYANYIPDIDKAIDSYNEALKINTQMEIFEKLKSLHKIKLDYSKIVDIIKKQIGLAEVHDQHDLYIELGLLYFHHLHDYNHAVKYYQKALDLDCNSLLALKNLELVSLSSKKYELLIDVLTKKQKLLGDAEIDLQIANIYQSFLEKPEKAIAILEDASEKYSNNIQIKEKLCSIYREKENWEKLINLYGKREKLAKINLDRAHFLFLQGKIYEEELFDQKTAAKIYVKTLTVIPDHLPAIKSLQRVYQKESNIEALTESYLAELAIGGISRKRKEALHIFCAELFEKNLDQKDWAVTHYLQVLKIDANNLVAIRGLQNLYRERKQYDKLKHVLFAELSIEKNVRRLFLVEKELAEIALLQFEDFAEATTYYIKAHETLPEKREIFDRLKTLLRNQERWEEYAKYVEKELEHLAPQKKRKMYLDLIEIYQTHLEKKDRAIFLLENMIDEFGTDLSLLEKLQELYGNDYDVVKYINLLNQKLDFTLEIDSLVDLHFEIGSLKLNKIKNFDEAVVHFQKALELKPQSKKIFNVLAKLYTKQKEWQKLIELYSLRVRYVKKPQKEREFFYKMGTIFEKKLKNTTEAIKYYELALTNEDDVDSDLPTAPLRSIRKLCEAKRDWTSVVEYLMREIALVKVSKERATLYYKLARIWEQKLAHPHQAVKYYLKVLDDHYHEPTAKHAIGLLKGIKDYTSLCQLLEKMIQRCADNKKTYLLCELGNILFLEEKDPDKAIAIYREILILDKDNIEALGALETIYEQQRDWENLVEVKQQRLLSAKDKNDRCNLHIDLGRTYEHYIFLEKDAIYHYKEALLLHPRDVNLLHTLQHLYKNWGYFEPYIDLCHQEISIIGDHNRKIYLWSEMATVWENRLFENNAAIVCYKEIIKIDSHHNNAIVALIRLYNYIEDYENLVDIYKLQITLATKANIAEEVIPLQLTTANILYHQLNKLDEAEDVFKKVLQVSSENEQALEALQKLYKRKNDIEGQGNVIEKAILLEKDRQKQAELYEQLGEIYQSDDRFQERAIDAYEKVFEITENSKTLFTLQKLYRDLHNNELLIGTNRRLLQIDLTNKEQADLHFEIGCILQEKSIEKAIEEFQKTSELLPSYKENFKKLAECWYKLQNWSEFIVAIERQIAEESNRKLISQLFFQIGKVYFDELKDVDQAKNYYQKSIEYDRQNTLAIYNLADIFYDCKLWMAARNLYQQLTHLSSDHYKMHEIYYTLGNIADKLQDTEAAILCYQKSLENTPDYPLSLDRLANLYYDNSQWDEALLYYMKLENSPVRDNEIDMVKVSLRLAIIKDKMGMTEGAIDGYIQHLKDNADEIVVLEGLARLNVEKCEWDLALEHYEKLLSLKEQDDKDTIEKIAVIHERKDNWSAAQNLYGKLCEQSPDNIDFLEKYIAVSCELQDWKNAQSYVEKQMDMCENNFQKVSCIMSLAKIHWKGGRDPEKATPFYEKALQIMPQNFQAIHEIAKISIHEEKYQQAIDSCNKYLQNFTEDDEEYKSILSIQALCYLKYLEEPQKAAKIYEKICEIDPDHTEAHAALANIWAKDKKQMENAATEHFYLILKDPFRRDSYNKLFDLYKKDNLFDRMYLCCQAASLLGKLLPKEKLFFESVTPRVASGWLETVTQDKFIPQASRGTLYDVMSSIDMYTDKAFAPLWDKYPSLEKKESFKSNEEIEIQDCIHRIIKFLSLDQVSVYTYEGSDIYLENTNPVSIVIGLSLWRKLTKKAQKFVLTRTLFYAARKQVMAYKLTNKEYANYISVVVESFADTGKPVSENQETIMRKLRNSLPRKIKKQLEERMDVLTEVFQADTNIFRLNLEKAANNCGLLMSDSLKSSMEGYCAIKNIDVSQFQDAKYIDMIKELFCFNISEEHSILRRELGLEVKWLK
ncbi:tetratricopeptide repeat protein [Candidatus Uabimicrobium sp. HlEnr_7]|uniref:tetratricopeptide repeat protein n=1 Tax=Candidatus Uabimicrobium helgolandensis TaxID=3095367 RepID=UPI003555EE0D